MKYSVIWGICFLLLTVNMGFGEEEVNVVSNAPNYFCFDIYTIWCKSCDKEIYRVEYDREFVEKIRNNIIYFWCDNCKKPVLSMKCGYYRHESCEERFEKPDLKGIRLVFE